MRSPARVRLFPVLVVMLIAALGAIGCDEVESLDNFDVPVTAEAVIPAGTPLEVRLGDFPQLDAFTRIDIVDSAAFTNGGYDADDVDSITLTSMVMVHTAPVGPTSRRPSSCARSSTSTSTCSEPPGSSDSRPEGSSGSDPLFSLHQS